MSERHDRATRRPGGRNARPGSDNPYDQGSYARDPSGPGPAAPGGQDDPDVAGRPPRRRRPIALIVILAVVGVCLLLCVGGVAYAFLQVGPGLRDSISDITSTQVADQLGDAPAGPGTYVITADQLTAGLSRQLAADGGTAEAAEVTIDPSGIEVRVDLGGQTVSYRAGLAVADGEIRVTDAEADAGVIGNILPVGWVAGGLEDGLNAWFSANGLTVTAVELGDGQVEITTEPRSGE